MTAAPPPLPDPGCGVFDLGCRAGQATESMFASVVDQVAQGAADLVVTTAAWWAETDSVDPADSAVLTAQGVTRPLVVAILVGAILVQAIRLILSRKAEPLVMVATGLFRFAVVSALGILTLQGALRAGDAIAADLLDGAAENFALLMRDALTAPNPGSLFVILLVSVVAAVLSLVQWVLMAVRQAGLLILAAMLPLAASGSLTRSTRGWLDKLIVWLIAIVVYKPAAAFIYYIGFTYLSTTSSNQPGDVSTMITGLVVLVLAVVAMPVLLKFFSWSGTQLGGSNGGGSGLLGAAGAVAMSRAYGQSPAVARAAAMEATGPGSRGGPPGAAVVAGRGAGGAAAAGVVLAAGVAAARGTAGADGERATTRGRPAVTARTPEQTGPRLYGNWRAERGWGVGGLSTSATVIVFVAVLVPLLAVSAAPVAALPLAAMSGLVVAGVVVRIGGLSAADVLTRWARFHWARAAGWTELSGGLFTDHPRGSDLPGVLAPLLPVEVEDGRGGRHALLWNRRTGTLSAVLRCSPVGLDLADPEQVDGWVAAWGAFLADLGYQPLVRHLSVTVDSVPAGGTSMREHVARCTDPAAPEVARRVLDELVTLTPTTTAAVDVRVTICLDPDRATPKPADRLAAVVEAARWLPGLEAGLGACGVAVLGRADVGWLTGRIRAAFEPGMHADATSAPDGVLAWPDAAPVAAREGWDRYRHEDGLSVSWALRDAPRQAVGPSVLAPLLAPGPFARRTTWLYEPYPADQAAARVEAEVTSGQIRRAWASRTRRDETQRDRDDRERAVQSAREEAEGAGVGRFTLYVTTTVLRDDDLAAAVADVEQRAGQAKVRLRRLRGCQAAGFAAALGVGINPAELLATRGGR